MRKLLSFMFCMHSLVSLSNVCDRSSQVVVRLERELNKSCDNIDLNDLAQIVDLNFSFSNFSSVEEGDFSGLESLKTLDLSYNKIRHFDVEVFRGLSSLENLNLSSNLINVLDPLLFLDLNSLIQLSLSSNEIKHFDPSLFYSTPSLERLDVSRNSDLVLDRNFFVYLKTLKSLRIGSEKQNFSDPNFFFHLKNLKILTMYCDEVGEISSSIFRNLNLMTNLAIVSRNKSNFITPGLFDGLDHLVFLNLSFLHLSEVDSDLFLGLSSLKTLDLSQNNISNLETGAFSGLRAIESIDLRDNPLSRTEEGVFSGIYNDISSEIVTNCDENVQTGSDIPAHINVKLNSIPLAYFPDSDPSTPVTVLRNPYQCPGLGFVQRVYSFFDFSIDSSPFREPFHASMMKLDSGNSVFTQIERMVPKLESSFYRDYSDKPATAHYGFNLIPSLDGSYGGLQMVRELAVVVCQLVNSFCEIRQEIHEFPTQDHLTATIELRMTLISQNASQVTIAKVLELEEALLQMFSKSLDYEAMRERLPDGELKDQLDAFFNTAEWSLREISEVVLPLQVELMKEHSTSWNRKYFISLFKVKAFLIHTYKTNFWKLDDIEFLRSKHILKSLVLMSQSTALLRSREADYLLKKIQTGVDLDDILKKSIEWQISNLERENTLAPKHFSLPPILEQFTHPSTVLRPLLEKMIRTSILSEWNRLI